MVHPARGRRTRVGTAARLEGAALLLIIVALAIWSGCTVTKQNYKALSFLFDGVPDPSLPPGSEAGRLEGGKPVFVVIHKPYAEERCDACHRTRYRPSRNDSGVCLECHASVKVTYPHVHGAVEAAACLWCHNPHESSRPALLRDSDRKMCAQCHTLSMLGTTKVPAHSDAARGCLECHSGHGGTTSSMLKPDTTAAALTQEHPGTWPEKK